MSLKTVVTLSRILLFITFFVIHLVSHPVSSLAPAAAAGLLDSKFKTKTHVMFKEDAMGHNYTGAYEYINLDLEGHIGRNIFAFHSGGWYRHHFHEIPRNVGNDRKRGEEEITYAFLRYTPPFDDKLHLSIGRQLLFTGFGSEYIDGISAACDVTRLTGLSLYGGFPLLYEEEGSSDSLFGGRLFQRFDQYAEMGLSYLRERDNHSVFREDMGVDMWFQPLSLFELQGRSTYNYITGNWPDHSYHLRILPLSGPLSRIRFTTLFAHTDYKEFFSSTSLDAFFPDTLGQNEKLTKVGSSLEYIYNKGNTLTLDFTNYNFQHLPEARLYGISWKTGLPGRLSAGASLHRIDGGKEELQYTKYRVYAMKNINKVDLTLDSMYIHYDKALSDRNSAYSLGGSLGYAFHFGITVSSYLEYLKDQDFRDSVTFLLTLEYIYE